MLSTHTQDIACAVYNVCGMEMHSCFERAFTLFFINGLFIPICPCTLNMGIGENIVNIKCNVIFLFPMFLLIAQICGGVSNRSHCQGGSDHDNLPTTNSSVRPTGKPSTLMLLMLLYFLWFSLRYDCLCKLFPYTI